MSRNNQHKNMKINKLAIVALGLAVIAIAAALFSNNGKEENQQVGNVMESQFAENGDLLIPITDITEKASFYSLEVDGTKLEVLALKAPDGTIRTAFNTCQVCYNSGRGYYVQEGDALVCQNCGNRFSASDVEVTRGGCNPVPISEEYKTVDQENISISMEFLKEAVIIFGNWKS